MNYRTRLVALLLPVAFANASAQQRDTVSRADLFTWRDAVLGAGFIIGTYALRPVDKIWAQKLQNPRNQENRFLNGVATVFRTTAQPGSVIIGVSMYTIGRLSKEKRLADLGLHGTEALAVGALTADGLKIVFGRARPYVKSTDSTSNPDDWQFGRGLKGNDYSSFPSGHTTAGFAAAAAVTNEMSRWRPSSQWYIGPLMFGGATMIGLSRMYNNRHWATDVMMGAAIGTFAGNKVVRYHHRVNPTNRWDKWLLDFTATPVHTSSGLHLSWSVVPRLVR
jgi:membrane-associated phospholipid phosphatase